jgi:hypothetical protein
MEDLADAYLEWRYNPEHVPSSDENITIRSFDLFTLDPTVCIHRSRDCISTARVIVKQGFLGNSPVSPSAAISLKTLELFRRIRLRKGSFSVEAFAKVICDFYMVSLHYYAFPPQLIPSRFHFDATIVLCFLTPLTFTLRSSGS